MVDATELQREGIREFLERKEPGALLLTGPWGIGKTFLWRKIQEKLSGKSIAYVSLFGATSISEVRLRILAAGIGKAKPAEGNTDIPDFVARLRGLFSREWWMTRAANEASKFDSAVARTLVAGAFEFASQIIVLDDLERRDPELTIVAVLGLVDTLVQGRSSKVVLICHEEMLHSEEFAAWREKVFDVDIRLQRSPEDVAMLAIPDTTIGRDALREAFAAFGCTNFRVAMKAVRLMNRLNKWVEKSSHGVVDELAQHVALFTWARFGMPQLMSIAELREELDGQNWFARDFDRTLNKGEQRAADPKADAWEDALKAVRWSVAEYDSAILDLLEFNVTSDETVSTAFGSRDELERAHVAEARLNAVWDSTYRDFSVGKDRFVEDLRKVLLAEHAFLSYNSIAGSLEVLAELGAPIDDVIAAARANCPQTLIKHASGDKVPVGPKCKELDAAADELARAATPRLNLPQALEKLGGSRNFDGDTLDVLASATPAEVLEAILAKPGPNSRWLSGLAFVAGIGGGSDKRFRLIRSTYAEVRDQLAARSEYDAYRVRHMLGGPVQEED